MWHVRFVWDEDKAAAVQREHHIDFAQIIDIFNDPCAVEFVDEAHSAQDEVRYAITGLTAAYGLVHLVFSETEFEAEPALRFITARRAEPWMVDEYEKNKRRT
jgi:uncharacterized protein